MAYTNPLQNYAMIKKKAPMPGAPEEEKKPFAFSPEYTKLQGEREGAIKAQFAAAQRGLSQKEAQTKDEISTGLSRLEARVGGVGGSVEKARQKALNESTREYSNQYQDLAANEAAAVSGLKGEDAARMLEGEKFDKSLELQKDQFAQQMGLSRDQFEAQKNQFGQQMAYSYKELDENLKTNMLNAITTLKKAGINSDNISKLMSTLTGVYGGNRISGLLQDTSVANGVASRVDAQGNRTWL